MYRKNPNQRKFHGLVIGEKGTGKTSLIRTCPKPVLVHSFDPGGTDVLLELKKQPDGSFKKELPEGIYIQRFEEDEPSKPHAYIEWQTAIEEVRTSGLFKTLGTYVLDSTTTFSMSMLWQILKKEGRINPGMSAPTDDKKQGVRQQDWGQLLMHMISVTRSLMSVPCHTLILGHVLRDKDEITGGFVKCLAIQGQSKDQVPILAEEYYVLLAKPTSDKLVRTLLTENSSEYRASTRMGARLFDKEEPADIRALLKKAGFDWEDVK